MIKKITILVFVFVLPILFQSLAHSTDIKQYLHGTPALVKEGKYKEALERYIWFHNHALEYEPSLSTVRLTFGLAYWVELGKEYPPAIEALKRIRDEKTAILEKGSGDKQLFKDITKINEVLNIDTKSLVLFKKLDKEQQVLANECWYMIKGELVKAQEYELLKKYYGDLIDSFNKLTENFLDFKENYIKGHDEIMEVALRTSFINEVLLMIEVAKILDQNDIANEIQEKALEVLNEKKLKVQ